MDLTSEPQQSLDLRAYARILWRWKLIFLAVVIAVPVVVYFVARSSAKKYEASVVMEVQSAPVDTSLFNAQSSVPDAQSVAIAARLIQTSSVAQAAVRQLPPPRPSIAAVLGSISTSVDPNTLFITVTSTWSNPQEAAAVANAVGSAVDTTRTKEAIRVINAAITKLKLQLASVPANAPAARNPLSNQIQRLRVLRAAQGSNAQVIQSAGPPSAPVSPNPRRDAELALVVAVLLGLGLVALAESLDRRIRRPEDLERVTGLALLSSVPTSAFEQKIGSPVTIEAFRSLRAHLEFFNVDREIHSLVVTSGRQGEGKTMVALNLAKAFELAGTDVIFLEADLRRPAIASRLELPDGPGLCGVLKGKIALAEALLERRPDEERSGRLRVLPAGEVPPNPAELLNSQRMHRLVEELTTMCELVIIDTCPLLAVSDALPLLDRVSGTLLVARLTVIRRDELLYLRRVLDAAQSMAVGVVATGTTDRESYPYAYSYGHDAEQASGNGASSRRPLALGRRRP